MNWVLEYFEGRKTVLRAAERMRQFFERAPELKSMGAFYADAISKESSMAHMPGYTRSQELPRTLDQFWMMPVTKHTAEVLQRAAELSRHVCAEFGASFTHDYPELVRRLYAKDRNSLRKVHGAYISDLMAAEYLLYRPACADGSYRNCDWLFSVQDFTPKPLFINSLAVCGFDLPIFSQWRADQLRDSVLIEVVKKYPSQARQLCSPMLNRPHVLEKMISEGFFPNDIDGDPHSCVMIRRSMPLSDALSSLLKCNNHEVYERICLTGLIKRHSIGYVVQAADTDRLKRVLPRLYTPEELLPFVKDDQFTKGLLLEESLWL